MQTKEPAKGPFSLQTGVSGLVRRISDDHDRGRGDRRGLHGPNDPHASANHGHNGRSADGSNRLQHKVAVAKLLEPRHTAHRELPNNHQPRRILRLEEAALPHNEWVVVERQCKPGPGRMLELLTRMLRGHCITILLSIDSPF